MVCVIYFSVWNFSQIFKIILCILKITGKIVIMKHAMWIIWWTARFKYWFKKTERNYYCISYLKTATKLHAVWPFKMHDKNIKY